MTQQVRNSYRKHRKATRGLALLLALTVVGAVVLIGVVGSGSAASTNKTLNCTTIEPNPVAATGTDTTFTLHLCNDGTSPGQLGSAKITPPTGFSNMTVSAAGLPAGASWDPTTSVLTNLAIAPGTQKDITIHATPPSLCSDPGDVSWSIYAKQANNFSGSPGNNFYQYPQPLIQHISVSFPCTVTTQGDNGSSLITTASDGFDFVIVNSVPSIDPSVTNPDDPSAGCRYFRGTGAGFDERDGRHADGTLDFTLSIADKALKGAYGANYGQPNVPICVGAKRLDTSQQTIDCNTDVSHGQQGFDDRTLGPDGKYSGTPGKAQCGVGGYWWGVLGTKLDPNPPFDSSKIPLITGWGGTGSIRSFNIHVPAGWDFTPHG